MPHHNPNECLTHQRHASTQNGWPWFEVYVLFTQDAPRIVANGIFLTNKTAVLPDKTKNSEGWQRQQQAQVALLRLHALHKSRYHTVCIKHVQTTRTSAATLPR